MTSKSKAAEPNMEITKKDLMKMAVNPGALGMEFSWNYPRQMHMPFCLMINPLLKRIYKNNPEGYKKALVRHMQFFNITPQLAPFVGGIAVSMEEQVAKGELSPDAVDNVKAALMGPLSGVGDSIFLGCIRVIAVAVGVSLAANGNVLGPILYTLIYNIPAFLLRIFGAVKGYDLGVTYLAKAQKSGLIDSFMYGAGILGIMVIGAMSKDMVYSSVVLQIGSGDYASTIQSIMDSIMPGMLGMGVTWLYYWALSKKISPMVLILASIVVGVVCVWLGVLG